MDGEAVRDEDTQQTWQEAYDALDLAEDALKRLGWLYPGVSDAVQGVLVARRALIEGKRTPRIFGPGHNHQNYWHNREV